MRALLVTLALAACAGLPQSDRGPEMGHVDYAGQSWPIHAWPNGAWRVIYERETVRCTRPTVESCYWSLRHHVNSKFELLLP